MEEKRHYVYKHTNKINGKTYIGITRQNPQRRWRNGKGYVKCPRFYRAIEKYGWDGFYHEILYENLSEEKAKNKEVELIKQYKSYDYKFGYNSTFGGELNIPTVEVRRKISISKIGKYKHDQNANAKKVVCMNNLYLFKTINDASRYGGVCNSHIAAVCKKTREYSGRHPSTGEFLKWEYYDDYVRRKSETNLHEVDMSNYCFNNRHKVICIELNRIFKNTSDAKKFNGSKHIKACCDNVRKTAGGYHWMYYEDYLKLHNETNELNETKLA